MCRQMWVKPICFIFFPPTFRWNVVGFQGSLMSYFTEPIYFSSIILGSLYHADHLSRAMYQRIADIDDLPQSFSLNRPLLSGENLRALERFPPKASHLLHLCCWCDGSQYTFGSVRGQKSLQFWKLSPGYRVALNTFFCLFFVKYRN